MSLLIENRTAVSRPDLLPVLADSEFGQLSAAARSLASHFPAFGGCGDAVSAPGSSAIHAAELELLAIQLASIRENYAEKGLLERLAHRFQREFRQQGIKGKARFLASIGLGGGRRMAAAIGHRLTRRRRPRPAACLDTRCVNIAVVCAGGMGDLAIYSALLDHLHRAWNRPLIHVVVHPQRMTEASFVFHDSPAVSLLTADADVDPATTPYDVVLRLGDFFSVEFVREDRLRQLAPQLHARLAEARLRQRPYRTFIQSQPHFDGLFTTFAARTGLRRLDLLGWLAMTPFSQQSQLRLSPQPAAYRRLIEDLRVFEQPYITIHNGWDNVAHRHTVNATKAWPARHYERFVKLFKQQFPGVRVIQLGAHTSQPIPNVDLRLLNGATLHEAAWILKNSLLHVDGDSGLVHLARSLHTPSLVMFGPTNDRFFAYDQNLTLASANCRNCWWTTNDWMRHCARGLTEPECMVSITPDFVLKHVERHMQSLRKPTLTLERAMTGPKNVARNGTQAALNSSRAFHVRQGQELLTQALDESRSSSKSKPAVAIIDSPTARPQLHELVGCELTRFRFATDEEFGTTTTEAAHTNDPCKDHRDFGSIYNIPAESSQFDVAALYSLNSHTAFPQFAVAESLRLVRDGGWLVLAYDFLPHQAPTASENAAMTFVDALRDLGINADQIPSGSGVLLLRKQSTSLACC